MKKLFSFVLVLLIITSTATIYAQSISTDKAIDIGVRFFEQATNNSPRYAPARTIGENMVTTRALQYFERECMYLVSMPDSGWVLVSGDERVAPILAVSYMGSFPTEEDMPPAMRNLLEDYANEIIYIQDSISDSPVHPQWATLESTTYTTQSFESGYGSDIYTPGTGLLNRPNRGEVRWNQGQCEGAYKDWYCDYAYNKFCPDWYTPVCGRTYVGCTAVAMAQIMWYWQWPHTAYIYDDIETNGDPKGNRTLHLYDWSIMPHQLTPSTPMKAVDMVAGFLRDCGYACKMKYKSNGSSATLENAMEALENVFAYENDIDYRTKFWTIKWEVKLREEINHGRPVLYAGYNDDGGHAFVVDGYSDSDPNLFHINWGWGGRKNDYFCLSSLCPPGHNYNDDQEALLGIQPAPCCDPYNTNGVKTIRYGTHGALIVDTSVEPGEIGAYYSGTSVTLKHGFHAKAGSKVHVAIQHFPCDGIAPASLRAPQQHRGGAEEVEEKQETSMEIITEFHVSPNPVQDILQITSSEPIEIVAIYTLSGEKVLQATTTQVDVSHLKEGMYIVHTTSQTGSHYTAKIVKQ